MIAFEILYNKYNDSLNKFLFTILNNQQDVEDILQETWMTVFEQFKKYNQLLEFRPWLFEIAKNLALDLQKSFSDKYEIPISNLGEEEYSEMNNILYSIYEETYAN